MRERRKQRLSQSSHTQLRVEGASFQATRTQESNVVKSSKSVGSPRTRYELGTGYELPLEFIIIFGKKKL